MCVHAPEVSIEYEEFTEHLDAVSACSNGITVDHQAPIGGRVWTGGPTQHQSYQVGSRNLLYIQYWYPPGALRGNKVSMLTHT